MCSYLYNTLISHLWFPLMNDSFKELQFPLIAFNAKPNKYRCMHNGYCIPSSFILKNKHAINLFWSYCQVKFTTSNRFIIFYLVKNPIMLLFPSYSVLISYFVFICYTISINTKLVGCHSVTIKTTYAWNYSYILLFMSA